SRHLDRARRLRDQARSALNQRQYAAAVDWAEQAAAAAGDAYLATCASRSGELRGAWLHSPDGIADWGWDKTIRALAENGFNAMFPNFCWGYVADYPSEVLPVHPDVARRGDVLQECLDACRKYGVELHVWKVNWNMGMRTPKELREQMHQAGRTQVTLSGAPTQYLAPHRQDNFELERDAMLELVRKYPIDGIHFDYIRYPDNKCDYSPDARAAFEANRGQAVAEWPKACAWGGPLWKEYNRWRQANISRLVAAVYSGAKAIRADIRVSAAVFSGWESAPESVAQSAAEWIDNGWLDFVCPMNYTTDYASLQRLLEYQVQRVGGRIPIYSGLGTYLHDGPVMTGSQVELSRTLGADGVVCFDLRRTLVENILPPLGKNVFAASAGPILPHHVETPTYVVSAGRADLENGYQIGDTLSVQVSLPAAVARARRLEANFSCDGRPVLSGREVQIRRRGNDLVFSGRAAVAGRYRLELLCADLDFLSRSPVYRVYDEAEAAEIHRRESPPQFTRRGALRVGVWQHDAYGAGVLLQALQELAGVEAQPLLNLKPESLSACQVVVLPQPRKQQALFKAAATGTALNAYVRQGGGLLVTHALVGIRGFVNPVPEVVATAAENALPGRGWKAVGGHAVTAGIGRQVQMSTFGDRVKVTPARGGTVVAATEDGAPVMIVGTHGRGRYAACGLGLGIGNNDQDSPLSPGEQKLLQNTVKWLGK
ncbi:MAG: family 10 glycosylhydrolase, partial [Lentisphaeria bacterium]|nr:family 10 glycosylhydrolase [Lentisphaeria bacterium]